MSPTTTTTATTADTIICPLVPTKFVVESQQHRERHYTLLFGLLSAALGSLWFFDPHVEKDWVWVLGGLIIGLIVLETAPIHRTVQLSVDISPMGIQQTTTIYDRTTYHPLLPRSVVRDCILVEHVEAFGVSSHLVFRVDNALVPAFPNARLSFSQCQSLLEKINGALKET